MLPNALRTHATSAALLTALMAVSGCGKNPVAPKPEDDGHARATQAANMVAAQPARMAALDFTRGLFVPGANPASGTRARTARPARAGSLAQDDQNYAYEIDAFDAAGNPVPYESTPWEQIQRVAVRWDFRWNHTSPDGEGFMRGHAAGAFDVSGFLPAATEVALAGTSGTTFEYRMVFDNQVANGKGTWAMEVQGMRWSKDPEANPYPLAGRESVSMDMTHGSAGKAELIRADVVIVYDGTQWARLTVDGRFQYRLDLESGMVEPLPA